MTSNATLSRGIWGYAGGALAGAVSACILAFALAHAGSILVLFAYLAPIPLFMVGFAFGTLPTLVASMIGTAALFAAAPGSFAEFYLIGDAVPVTAIVAVAMRRYIGIEGQAEWCSEGHILTALASYPCLIFFGIYAATAGHEGGLLAMTRDAFHGMSDQVTAMLIGKGQTLTPDMTVKLHQYFETCARITPALAMCAWLFSTLLAMGVAQSILHQRHMNVRPPFSLLKLHVPNWVIFAAAITGMTASFAPEPYDYIGLNLALVLGIPFFFVGLAVIHAWARRMRFPTLSLIAFYVTIGIIVHLVLVVALLGAIDQWIDFRKRLTATPSH